MKEFISRLIYSFVMSLSFFINSKFQWNISNNITILVPHKNAIFFPTYKFILKSILFSCFGKCQ